MKRVFLRLLLIGTVAAEMMACRSSEADSQTASAPQKDKGASIMKDGTVDHSAYDALLKTYVDSTGYVDYRTWKASDEGTLDAYLADIGRVNPEALKDQSEKLVFWINVYNALTLKGILHFYPTKSIKDHVSVLGYNIWKDYKITISGREYSLDEIEHGILRKMGEPRIHFAIVCASGGCPSLRNEAYTRGRLEEQLVDNARLFFAHPEKFRVDIPKKTVYLSPILDWFKEDFGKDQAARLAFVRTFVQDAGTTKFLEGRDVGVKYLDYDWNLNDQGVRR